MARFLIRKPIKEETETPTTFCAICYKTFKSVRGLHRHNLYMHRAFFTIYRCELCFDNTSRIDTMRRHIRSIHHREPKPEHFTMFYTDPKEPKDPIIKPSTWQPPFEARHLKDQKPQFIIKPANNQALTITNKPTFKSSNQSLNHIKPPPIPSSLDRHTTIMNNIDDQIFDHMFNNIDQALPLDLSKKTSTIIYKQPDTVDTLRPPDTHHR